MACKLAKSTKPWVDFEGKAGDQVKLGVTSDSGGAVITSVVYDGASLSAPWTVTLSAGKKILTVVVDNPVPRDWTTIQELCDSGASTLKHYTFDPYGPAQSFVIEAS